MKNLNSFKAIARAIAYETRRQIELIEDGKTGVLLPPGDTKALGAALCRLDLEPERLAAMTAACRADAFLSVQDYTDKLLSDYNA